MYNNIKINKNETAGQYMLTMTKKQFSQRPALVKIFEGSSRILKDLHEDL